MYEPETPAPQLIAPLTLGEVVSRTFTILGRGFGKLAALVVLGNILIWISSLFWMARFMDTFNYFELVTEAGNEFPFDVFTPTDVLAFSLIMIVSLVLSAWMNGAMVHMASVIHYNGDASIGASIKVATKRLFRAIGTYILIGLMAIIPTGIVFALMSLSLPVAMIATFVMVIAATYFTIRLGFLGQTIFIEDAGVTGAISRSWALVKGYWWHTFGYILILGLVGVAVSLVFGFIPIVGQLVSTFVVTPISIIGSTLVYWDLRARQERLTTETVEAELNTEDPEPGLPSV